MSNVVNSRVQTPTTNLAVMRAAAVATSSYVAGTGIHLPDCNCVLAVITIAIPTPAEILYAKPQWSHDGVTYYDEPILVNAASITSPNEMIQTAASRVIAIDCSVAYVYPERSNRLAQWFRMAVKSSANPSTSTAAVGVVPMILYT